METSTGIIESRTVDLSSSGLFLEMDSPIQEGTRVRVTLQFPEEITGRPLLLKCIARVVRVSQEQGRPGVGAAIERFQSVRALET